MAKYKRVFVWKVTIKNKIETRTPGTFAILVTKKEYSKAKKRWHDRWGYDEAHKKIVRGIYYFEYISGFPLGIYTVSEFKTIKSKQRKRESIRDGRRDKKPFLKRHRETEWW